MIPTKILLFSADATLAHLLANCLVDADFMLVLISDGLGALDAIHAEKPTLLIFDKDLPGCNSLAIIRALRSEESNGRLPVILLGENMREEDVLLGLEVGADLCLLEAFHPQVFVARVRSLLRRTELLKKSR
jgi:DNA-binding response OmpR family regulator